MKKLFTLFLILFSTLFGGTLTAQELKVASFEPLPQDVAARSNAVLDNNDNPCALLRVVVPVEGIEIRGNYGRVGDVLSPRASEYVVYLPAGTKTLYVNCPGFMPLTYDIGYKLEGKMAYRLTLERPQLPVGPTKPEIKTQYVKILLPTAGSTVLIDGMPQPTSNGVFYGKFALGTHSYYISAPQHYPEEGEFALTTSGRIDLTVALKPSYMPLNLRVSPANATVQIDGQMLTLTRGQLTQKFEIGKHTYQISAPQHYTQTGEFEISATGQNSLNFNLKPSYMALNLRVSPSNATVLIDGTQYQLTGGSLTQKFEIGKHTYQIMASQYHSASGEFEITALGGTDLDITLKPAFGFLQATSNPVGAEVRINGEKRGVTPCKLQLPSGQYSVQLVSDGYISHAQQVTITDGVTLPFSNTLTANFAQITLKAPHPHSEIWVNDQFKAKGEWSGRLDANTYLVETRTEGYETVSENVEVEAGVPRTVTLQKPNPIYGLLEILSDPFDATIKLDGKVVGTTPWQSNEVLTGKHTLELSKEGYETKRESFTISRDTPKNINLTLNKQGSYVPGTAITYGNLFPILGVSLGKTTLKDLRGMTGSEEGYGGSYYRLRGITFYIDDEINVTDRMVIWYAPGDSSIPESWRKLGLSFSLNKEEIAHLFMQLGCEVKSDGLGVNALTSDRMALFEVEYDSAERIKSISVKTIDDGTFSFSWLNSGTLKLPNFVIPVRRAGTYRVGDYYNKDGKEGIVFWVDETGEHGKIVSLTELRSSQWSSDKKEQKQLIGTNNESDGAKNMAIVKQIPGWESKYPAFKWCADLGEGWYLPARNEARQIDNARDFISDTLRIIGRDDYLHYWWTSTETIGYKGRPYVWNSLCQKNAKGDYFHVRAVYAF